MPFLIPVLVGIATYLIADEVSVELTGRTLLDNAFATWSAARTAVNDWLHANCPDGVVRVVGRLIDYADLAAVSARQFVDIDVMAEDVSGVEFSVGKIQLTREELLEQFPELRNRRKADLTAEL